MALWSRKHTYALVLGGLVVILGLILLYGDQGLMRLHRLGREQKRLEEINAELKEENRRLMLRIERIKNDPRYIEDEARKKLGLIRPDETIYRLKEEPEAPAGGQGGPQAGGGSLGRKDSP